MREDASRQRVVFTMTANAFTGPLSAVAHDGRQVHYHEQPDDARYRAIHPRESPGSLSDEEYSDQKQRIDQWYLQRDGERHQPQLSHRPSPHNGSILDATLDMDRQFWLGDAVLLSAGSLLGRCGRNRGRRVY